MEKSHFLPCLLSFSISHHNSILCTYISVFNKEGCKTIKKVIFFIFFIVANSYDLSHAFVNILQIPSNIVFALILVLIKLLRYNIPYHSCFSNFLKKLPTTIIHNFEFNNEKYILYTYIFFKETRQNLKNNNLTVKMK